MIVSFHKTPADLPVLLLQCPGWVRLFKPCREILTDHLAKTGILEIKGYEMCLLNILGHRFPYPKLLTDKNWGEFLCNTDEEHFQ